MVHDEPEHIARTGQKLGLTSDARTRFERGVDPYEATTDLRVAETLNNLAGLLKEEKGDYAAAESLLREGLSIARKQPGGAACALFLHHLALCLDEQGKTAEALPLYEKALAIRVKVLGEHHEDTAISYNNLAINLAKDVALQGVTINNLSPGLIATERNKWRREDAGSWAEIQRTSCPMPYIQ